MRCVGTDIMPAYLHNAWPGLVSGLATDKVEQDNRDDGWVDWLVGASI
jgi:hypothetical protein